MNHLSEPFSHIFTDRAEADWAFDLLRDAARRLRVQGAYDPRLALTLSQRGGRHFLRLNFGGWLVLGFRGPDHSTERVDLALLAGRVAWDERFEAVAYERKEGEPEVRGYALPLSRVRPLTSDLRHAFEETLDFIAAKFEGWRRATHWKQHNPEIVEALFDAERRERLFVGGLADLELRYERHFTAFGQAIAEEEVGYEAEDVIKMNELNRGLAEPISRIFANKDEAEWAFDFLFTTLELIGVNSPDDPRLALTFNPGENTLRLNLGNWAILSFYDLNSNKVHLNFIVEQVPQLNEGNFRTWTAFARRNETEPEICGYHLPVKMVKTMSDNLKLAFETTLNFTARKFQNWRGTPYRRFHQPQIAEAIFDLKKREQLFAEGLHLEISGENDEDPGEQYEITEEVSLATIANESGFDEADLARWVRAIERKGQAVLYGPPGTGKTFLAHRLAAHLIGGGDGFTELVQFHPAYAYEDFIQGIRPRSEGGQLSYPLEPGRFLDFCRRAEKCSAPCVLIIDELNRANLSRVFGELMYLLEYRHDSVPLAGGGRLRIPANVRLIGTMNTADRSIALVDHALRRRFAFIRLWPNFEALRRYHHREQTGFPVDKLIELLAGLNRHIGDPHYDIGITFFLRHTLAADLPDIWQMEIEPYLEEYFFSQPDKLEEFRWAAIAPRFYHE